MSNQRIWILSDLHQEFLRDRDHGSDPLTLFDPVLSAPDHFDVVVLAGDVDVPLTRSLAWIADRFAGVEVVYVPGNHDFFVTDQGLYTMVEQLDQGRELANRLGIHLLADRTAVIAGMRFAGGTLWTDFMTVGRGDFRAKIAEVAGRDGMNDYRRIKRWSTANPDKRKRLRPKDTIASHHYTRAFLKAELAEPFAGTTVVVTHHCPHPSSLGQGRQRLNGATLQICRLFCTHRRRPIFGCMDTSTNIATTRLEARGCSQIRAAASLMRAIVTTASNRVSLSSYQRSS